MKSMFMNKAAHLNFKMTVKRNSIGAFKFLKKFGQTKFIKK